MILGLFVLFFAASTESKPTPHLSGKYEEIQSFKKVDLNALNGQPVLLYFFQPDCPSCAKQHHELRCLNGKAHVLALGVFGTKKEIQKEARRHSWRGPVLYGGSLAQEQFHVTRTPTLVLFDAQGNFTARFDHLAPCADLLTRMRSVSK